MSGTFGLAMAQIASAFPTAGGLYHWGPYSETVSPVG
jgi:amino acid transporter